MNMRGVRTASSCGACLLVVGCAVSERAATADSTGSLAAHGQATQVQVSGPGVVFGPGPPARPMVVVPSAPPVLRCIGGGGSLPGEYAIQTANGNYIAAVGGGGLASGSPDSDNLHTDATEVRSWEKFKFVDMGDCTYAIQTVNGWYLGFPPSHVVPGPLAQFTTRISDINAALKFKLIAAFVQ